MVLAVISSDGALSHVTIVVYNKMKFENFLLCYCQCSEASVSKVTVYKLSMYDLISDLSIEPCALHHLNSEFYAVCVRDAFPKTEVSKIVKLNSPVQYSGK
jgi:hypothetical protein